MRDPSKTTGDSDFVRQSLFLHTCYYMSIIGCRRSTLYLPSSVISCARAGQACIQLLASVNFAYGKPTSIQSGCYALSFLLVPSDFWLSVTTFAAAAYVQLGIWSELPELNDKATMRSDFTSAIDLLSLFEKKWVRAGKYRSVPISFPFGSPNPLHLGQRHS